MEGNLKGPSASDKESLRQARLSSIKGQTLVTVVNDPRADNKGWWGFGRQDLASAWGPQTPPPLDAQKYPNYTRKDLGDYLRIVQTAHQEFLHERESLAETANRQLLLGDLGPEDAEQQAAALQQVAAQGDGLAKALQKVPVHFFQEDFSIERSGLLSVGDGDGIEELQQRIDTLSQYLDVVETQMAREVATRSSAVSSAAAQVGVLNQQLCAALGNVRLLRGHLCEADTFTYTNTCHVMALQQRRRHVDATLEALQALEEVHSSRTALQLLLDGQDYAGALDLLEVVSHNVEATCTQGINAFATALPEMRETRELLESLLACEFVGLANFESGGVIMDLAIMRISEMGPGVAPTTGDMTALLSGPAGKVGSFMMRSGLELDPYSTDADGQAAEEAAAVAREQLHDKLLPVVLALLRVDRLSGAVQQLRENVRTATKSLVTECIARCLGPTGPSYLQQALGNAAMGLAGEVQGRQEAGGSQQGGSREGGKEGASQVQATMFAALQGVSHDGFMQVLFVAHAVVAAMVQHCMQLMSIIRSDILPAARVPPMTMAAVTRDIASVTQALADAAQAQWVKLLNSRSSVTPRLKQYEFQGLSEACEAFAVLLEPLGVKAAVSVRHAIQTQGRVFLDGLHARNAAQLQHLLEAEQWGVAEVHPQFQTIVDRLLQKAAPPAITQGHAKTASWGGGSAGGVAGVAAPHTPENGRSHSPGGSTAGGAPPPSTPPPPHTATLPPGLLHLQGKAFPLVNTTLMLLKLLDEYLTFADNSPMFVLEVGHHVCDLIKVFNTQACQLVLGAGAVRTAGLRSISAKHLALSCESCYMLARLVPTLRAALLASPHVIAHLGASSLEPRRRMLLLEFEKVAADLGSHTSEIHSKLVDIMQDRLVAAARQLTQDASTWGTPAGGSLDQLTPSQALLSLNKQLSTLHSVLGPLLQPEEVHYIFGRVASLYSEALAATFDGLQHPKLVPAPAPTQPSAVGGLARGLSTRVPSGTAPSGSNISGVSVSVALTQEELAAWEETRRFNAVYALQMLKQLPLEPAQVSAYLSRLSTFLFKHYGPDAMQPRPLAPRVLTPPPTAPGPASATSDQEPDTTPAPAVAKSGPPSRTSLERSAGVAPGVVAAAAVASPAAQQDSLDGGSAADANQVPLISTVDTDMVDIPLDDTQPPPAHYATSSAADDDDDDGHHQVPDEGVEPPQGLQDAGDSALTDDITAPGDISAGQPSSTAHQPDAGGDDDPGNYASDRWDPLSGAPPAAIPRSMLEEQAGQHEQSQDQGSVLQAYEPSAQEADVQEEEEAGLVGAAAAATEEEEDDFLDPLSSPPPPPAAASVPQPSVPAPELEQSTTDVAAADDHHQPSAVSVASAAGDDSHGDGDGGPAPGVEAWQGEAEAVDSAVNTSSTRSCAGSDAGVGSVDEGLSQAEAGEGVPEEQQEEEVEVDLVTVTDEVQPQEVVLDDEDQDEAVKPVYDDNAAAQAGGPQPQQQDEEEEEGVAGLLVNVDDVLPAAVDVDASVNGGVKDVQAGGDHQPEQGVGEGSGSGGGAVRQLVTAVEVVDGSWAPASASGWDGSDQGGYGDGDDSGLEGLEVVEDSSSNAGEVEREGDEAREEEQEREEGGQGLVELGGGREEAGDEAVVDVVGAPAFDTEAEAGVGRDGYSSNADEVAVLQDTADELIAMAAGDECEAAPADVDDVDRQGVSEAGSVEQDELTLVAHKSLPPPAGSDEVLVAAVPETRPEIGGGGDDDGDRGDEGQQGWDLDDLVLQQSQQEQQELHGSELGGDGDLLGLTPSPPPPPPPPEQQQQGWQLEDDGDGDLLGYSDEPASSMVSKVVGDQRLDDLLGLMDDGGGDVEVQPPMPVQPAAGDDADTFGDLLGLQPSGGDGDEVVGPGVPAAGQGAGQAQQSGADGDGGGAAVSQEVDLLGDGWDDNDDLLLGEAGAQVVQGEGYAAGAAEPQGDAHQDARLSELLGDGEGDPGNLGVTQAGIESVQQQGAKDGSEDEGFAHPLA